MKIFITGGAGFIGSHIAESLLKEGHQVKIYDNFSTGKIENLSKISNQCEIVNGDILDLEKMKKEMKNCDLVSHHSAQLEIIRGDDDPEFDLRINTVGTLNVLKAAKETGIKKVVNASSACIYGQTEEPTNEMFYPRPNWTYGVSKLAAEKYADIYNDYYKIPTVNLRYSIVYGEREWFRRVLTIFIKRAIQNLPLVVFGDGNQIRDFVYVGDVVRFNNLCLFDNKADGQAFNVGSGVATSIKELAQKVIGVSKKKLDIIYENTAEGKASKIILDKKRNPSELKKMILDVSKARDLIGWKPEISLEEGLEKEMNWASENLKRWEKIYYSV